MCGTSFCVREIVFSLSFVLALLGAAPYLSTNASSETTLEPRTSVASQPGEVDPDPESTGSGQGVPQDPAGSSAGRP